MGMGNHDQPPRPSASSAGSAKPWEHAKHGPGSGQDPLAVGFVESLTVDRRLYRHDIAGSIAHARMLCHTGIITSDELKQIEAGLSEIQAQIDATVEDGKPSWAWPGWKPELEDVHMCIEAALIEKIGDTGRKLHTGRSRNDQVALDLKLWIREANQELDRLFTQLFQAFVDLAQRDGHIVMPAYTHLQRAQPIAVGAELVAWLTALDRARQRLLALGRINEQNPLGSGAVAGSGLALDRHHTAQALPLGPPTPSSIDATCSRDAAIDFVYSLAMVSMTLSRWAEQWIFYASTEVGWIRLDGRYTTGSSMMPQKTNPDMLELIRGRCGGVYGHLVALMTICKGLGIGYFRDLQEDKTHVFQAFDQVRACLAIASKIVATTRFNDGKIKNNLGQGFLDATSLAEYLVTKSVPFRTAHQIVGALVRRCQDQGLEALSQLTLDDFNQACAKVGIESVCRQDMYGWLDPQQVVQRYATYGNAGASGFHEQLVAWQDRLSVKNHPD